MNRTGTHYELPGLPPIGLDTSDEDVAAQLGILRQCRPGAVVTYPDGTRYKVAWKPYRYYTCEASGTRWRVMKVRPLEASDGAT